MSKNYGQSILYLQCQSWELTKWIIFQWKLKRNWFISTYCERVSVPDARIYTCNFLLWACVIYIYVPVHSTNYAETRKPRMRISAASRGLKRSDVSSVRRWVHRFNNGEKDTGDSTRSDRTATTQTTQTKARLMCCFGMTLASRQVNCVPQYRLENRRLWPSSDNLATKTFAPCGRRKCSPPNTKQSKKHLYRTSPVRKKDGDAFLSRIITGDETWVHH
jgi:hypothetical protein